MLQAAYGKAQAMINGTHPHRVPARQVVVDRDYVDACARKSVQINGQGGYQGLALAGFHFGDLTVVQHYTADKLHVVVTLTQTAA